MDSLSNKFNLFKLEWVQDTQEFAIWKVYITRTEETNTAVKAKEFLSKILHDSSLQLLNIKSIQWFEEAWLFLVEVNEKVPNEVWSAPSGLASKTKSFVLRPLYAVLNKVGLNGYPR